MNSIGKNRLGLGFLLICMILSSCGPSPEDEQVSIPTKNSATANSSPEPTSTKKPTPVPSVTALSESTAEPGGMIAYMSFGNPPNPGVDTIYLIDPQLPDNPILFSSYPYGDMFPAWSPDGQQIALSSMHITDNIDIFMYSVDDTGVLRLTDDPEIDAQLDWSPNNDQVVFVSVRDGNPEIYLSDWDGNNLIRLTNDPGNDWEPAWSPDGNKIAFYSDRNGNQDIYLIDLDKGDLVQLTDLSSDEFRPDWSPDGNQIAYSAFYDDNVDLYTMNSDGSDVQRLTFHPSDEDHPSWSPDGAFIAYDSNRSGNYNIFIMDLISGEEIQLTMDPGDEIFPDWGQTEFEFGTDPWFGQAFCIRDVDGDYSPDETTDYFFTTDMFKYVGFQFRNMENGMDWSHGVVSSSSLNFNMADFWDSGIEGFHVLFLSAMSSEAGPFIVELYIEGELVLEVPCEVIEP